MHLERNEITQRLVGIIADQLSKEVEEIEKLVQDRPDIPLELLGIDELEHFELMINVEEAFECEISDTDADGLVTFGALVEYIDDCVDKMTKM